MRRRCLRMEGTAEIAARLGVSRQTVWGYRSSRTKRGDAKLREALDEYIDLYAEITAKGDGFDWTAYEKRIADIQKTYDEGVALMKSADQAMSGIVTDDSSGSASSAESASGEASDSASSEPAESEASSDSSDASSASA